MGEVTGGPLGSIGLLGPGEIAMYNPEWHAFLDGFGAWLGDLTGWAVSRDGAMMLVVWALAIALLYLFWRLERSPWGRVMIAIGEDETAAMAVGKNVFVFKLQALALGAVRVGLSFLLLAWQIGVFSPDDYQPTNAAFGLLPPTNIRGRRRERRLARSAIALEALDRWIEQHGERLAVEDVG